MSEQQQGHWAINYTPMLSVHDTEFKLSDERFHSADEAFRFLQKNGIDDMSVVVEHASYFYEDCNAGTCGVCGNND